MEKEKIDWSQYRRVMENEDIARSLGKPQAERERNPTFFERKAEQEGRSSMAGGVWAGRLDRSR